MTINDKVYRLKWLKAKREDLEKEGKLISLKQANEIAELSKELNIISQVNEGEDARN